MRRILGTNQPRNRRIILILALAAMLAGTGGALMDAGQGTTGASTSSEAEPRPSHGGPDRRPHEEPTPAEEAPAEEPVAAPTVADGGDPTPPAPAAPEPGFTPIPLVPGDTTPGLPTPKPKEPVILTHDPAAAGVGASFQVPGVPAHTPYTGGIDSYSAGPGCAASCIVSGVATPEGPGARLTVTTNVKARIWIVVWNDDKTFTVDSGSRVTSFSHVFDDLMPDTTYGAMAVAEDVDGYTDHRYGELHTLTRMMKVSFDHGQLLAVPDGTKTDLMEVDVWLNGVHQPQAWDHGIAPIATIQDEVDLRIRVIAHHPRPGCIGQPPSGSTAVPTSWRESGVCYSFIVLGTRDAAGELDPVSVLHDPAVEESDHYRRVERDLVPFPGEGPLDAIAGMSVEIVYV